MPKRLKMSGRQYQKIRETLDYSNYAFCHVIGVSLRQAQRYELDQTPIPQPVIRLLMMLAEHGIPDKFLP